MKVTLVGVCNHKNVCITCCLRVRLIMEEPKCQICRTELGEVFVTEDPNKMYEDFGPKFKKHRDTIKDKEDSSIFYENKVC